MSGLWELNCVVWNFSLFQCNIRKIMTLPFKKTIDHWVAPMPFRKMKPLAINPQSFIKRHWSFYILSVPRDDEIRVQNIQFGGFEREKGNTMFSVNCTWTGPAFNFTLRSYEVEYELSGYTSGNPTVRINVVWWLSFMVQ